MNYKMIMRINAFVLAIEAILMLPPLAIAIFTKDRPGMTGFLVAIGVALLLGALLGHRSRGAKMRFYEREGFVSVGLAWVIMSLVGCLPFYISGSIPNFVHAFFEIVSGFTTTGASICPDVEALSRSILWWRSFSHWIGGMGILVFFLAIIPLMSHNEGFSLHLLRAESPGPKVDKMVPRMRQSASLLYKMYLTLTVLDIIFLVIGKMPLFDAFCLAFGTAGTGGFGVLNTSLGSYTPFAQNVTTIFMLLFGVNFSLFYLMVMGRFLDAIKDEEFLTYVGIVAFSTIVIFINIFGKFAQTMTFGATLRHSAFQVASIITTTGYSTVDFDVWPSLAKAIMMFLMMVGASAGSTGGGIKVSRIVLLVKIMRRNLYQIFHPNEVKVVRMNGQRVDERTLRNVSAYLIIYIAILVVSVLLVSADAGNFTFTTNFSAVMATFNNIGPGFDQVGATCNFSIYNNFSLLVLTFDMLLGRLEIFPMLALLTPSLFRRR